MTDHSKKYFDLAVLLLVFVVGAILYYRTLSVPWMFDDIQSITDNSLIRSIPATLRNIFAPRGVAYLSFALNYHFGGQDVTGYHLFNISSHIMASWFVYLLAKRAFPSPTTNTLKPFFILHHSPFTAVFVGLIFLVHPIQTQTVNYIVQRMTGLSALFFLLTLYCYVRYRESTETDFSTHHSPFTIHGFLWYLLAVAMAVLALMTKQNAAVIPGVLLLFDWLVLGQGRLPVPFSRRILAVVPFLLISLLFIYIQVGKDDILLKDAGMAQFWTRAKQSSAVTKLEPSAPVVPLGQLPKGAGLQKPPENLQALYFVTELSVLWLYVRLLFLPYNQTFDYGYPLVDRIVDLQNIVAGGGLLVLMLLAAALARRKPLAAFGIFWFFLTLAVESTIIPLDAAVEHRLYVPVFGFAIAIIALIRDVAGHRILVLILCCLVIAYGIATWQRNVLWGDPVAFARDGVVKAPHNQRNHVALATAYADAGRWADAEKTLRTAIPLRPNYYIPYDNLGSALAQQGKFAESRTYFSLAAILAPDYPNAVYNYGYVSLRLGDMPAALRSLERLKELRSPLAVRLGGQFVGR